MRSLLAFLADMFLGLRPAPHCPVCHWIARGDRSLAAHMRGHGWEVVDV